MNAPSPSHLLSVVVPVYNEAAALPAFHKSLLAVLQHESKVPFELIYCDDGSTDESHTILLDFCKSDPEVKLLRLSRNFGKESALSAGIAAARGEAIITLDADGQHPPSVIPDLIQKWQQGAQVVIGVRTNRSGKTAAKRLGSWLYSKLDTHNAAGITRGASDFRLISRTVQQSLVSLPETDRITRNLIDWLGFERAYVKFTAPERSHGTPTYSGKKLAELALHSFVSSSPTPLYVFGILGIVITSCAFLLGTAVFIEQLILEDPLHWNFTGTAMLAILILFLVGLLLVSQGIVSLYVSHTHNQTLRRPLYVIDYNSSAGIKHPDEV